MLFFGFGVFLDGLLVFEDLGLFFDVPEERNRLVDLDSDEILKGLPTVAFVFDLQPVLITFLNQLTILHCLNQFVPGRTIARLFGLVHPHLLQILGKNLFLFAIELIHQVQKGDEELFG